MTNFSERAEVLVVLTAAFENDPAARALYPAAEAFQKYFPGFAESFSGAVFTNGIVDRSTDGLGVALWFPPGLEPDPTPVIAHLKATVDPARHKALFAGLEIQGALHPDEPHWYLPFIGVRPEVQGRGIGARLLQHGLDRADADSLPAYLEATSRRSVPLYNRHGFEVIGVVEAPDYPEIFAMWRPARAG
jgi:ribosomal protein S18 acetylase RimI-like enzyme